jgi:PAS domain S-box-containing protein
MKASFIEQHPVRRQTDGFDKKIESFDEQNDATFQSIQFLERLQRVTSSLSKALTRHDVARVIVEEGAKALSCPQGVMNLLDASGLALEPVYYYGYPEDIMARYTHIPLSFQSPITDVVAMRQPIFLEDQTAQRIHYPHIADDWLKSDVVSLVAMPLLLDERVIGTLGYSFPMPRSFSAQDKKFLLALAEQCVQALERARLYEVVQRSEEKYRTMFDSIDEGYCVFEMLFDQGKAVDYRFLEINPVFEAQTGLKDAVGKRALELVPQLEPHWIDIYGKVALTGESVRFEQGSEVMGRYFDVYAVRVGGEESRKVALVFNDITQRKQIEENLRRSEEHFRTLTETLPGFVWMDSAAGINQYMNSRWTEFTGQSPEEARGDGWEKVTHPEDIPHIKKHWEQCRKTGQTYELEVRHRHKDGHYCWFLAKGLPLRNEVGDIVSWVGTSIDITARKEAEEKLRLANERFRIAEDASNGFLYDYDLSTGAESRSEGFTKVLGYSDAEVPGGGARWESIMHPDDVPQVRSETELAVVSGMPGAHYEYRIRHKNGLWLWVQDKNVIVRDDQGKAQHIIGSIIDITERKQAEEQLRTSRQVLERQSRIFDTTLSTIQDYVYNFDRQGRFLYANRILLDLWGLSEDEALGKTMADLDYPKAVEDTLFKAVQEVFETGRTVSNETFYTSPDGISGYFENILSPFFSPDGTVEFVSGSSRDITFRKQAEAKLRSSEEFSRTVLENSPDCVKILDGEGRLQYMNGNGLCLMEIDDFAPFKNEFWWKFWLDESQPMVKASVTKALQGESARFQAFCPTAKGSPKWWDVIVTPVPGENGTVAQLISVSRDITENKKAEEEIVKQSRLLRYQTELLSLANEAIIVRDKNDKIVSWNKAATDLYGYSEEEAIGQISHDLFQTEFLSSREIMQEALEQAGFWEGEVTHRRKDGERIVLLSRQAQRKDEEGKPLEIVEVSWDISARKQVEIEREKLLAFTQRSEKEALALAEIASSFSLAKPFETNLNTIAERVVKTTNAAACAIDLFHQDGLLRLSGSYGYPSQAMEQGFREMYQNKVETLSQRAIRSREVVMIRDYIPWALKDKNRAPLHPFLKDLDWGTAVAMPLPTTRGYGAVNVFYAKDNHPDLTDLLQLSTIVSQIALVVENTRLFEEAQGKAALEERQRLARDLHDSVSQALYGINLGAQSAKEALRTENPEKLQRLEHSLDYLIHMAETATAEMKSLIFELRPESLESEGLVMALQKHLRALELRHRFQLHLNLKVEPEVSLKVKEMLYRITQEAMNNIIKHAQANQVWIKLETRADTLVLEISDDGIGFDTSQEYVGHLGLHSMRERAESVGAQWNIFSQVKQGTTVRVLIPYASGRNQP